MNRLLSKVALVALRIPKSPLFVELALLLLPLFYAKLRRLHEQRQQAQEAGMLRVVEAQRVAEEEEAAARKSFQEGVLAEPILIQTWTAEEAAQNLVPEAMTNNKLGE